MIAFLDFETGGLEPWRPVLEIALVVTDDDLRTLGFYTSPIAQEPGWEADLSDWARENHEKSGLLDEVRVCKRSRRDVELDAITHLLEHEVRTEKDTPGRTVVMGGSSCGFDRRVMVHHMPALAEYFHYRNLDVSSLREAVRRWTPQQAWPKDENPVAHRALADLESTIAEAKHYRRLLETGMDCVCMPVPRPSPWCVLCGAQHTDLDDGMHGT